MYFITKCEMPIYAFVLVFAFVKFLQNRSLSSKKAEYCLCMPFYYFFIELCLSRINEIAFLKPIYAFLSFLSFVMYKAISQCCQKQ
jgi:hypothetical protein